LHIALWTEEVESEDHLQAGPPQFRCKLAEADLVYYTLLLHELRSILEVKILRVAVNLPYGYADHEDVEVNLECLQIAVAPMLPLLSQFGVSVNYLTEGNVDKKRLEGSIALELQLLDTAVTARMGLGSGQMINVEKWEGGKEDYEGWTAT
jgi:hypothetical protein